MNAVPQDFTYAQISERSDVGAEDKDGFGETVCGVDECRRARVGVAAGEGSLDGLDVIDGEMMLAFCARNKSS